MVGDTSGDSIAAEECGVDFIGVTYGFGRWNPVDYKKNVRMADSPKDIY